MMMLLLLDCIAVEFGKDHRRGFYMDLSQRSQRRLIYVLLSSSVLKRGLESSASAG